MSPKISRLNDKLDKLIEITEPGSESIKNAITLSQATEGNKCIIKLADLTTNKTKPLQEAAALGITSPISTSIKKLKTEPKERKDTWRAHINGLLKKNTLDASDAVALKDALQISYQASYCHSVNKFKQVQKSLVKECEDVVLGLLDSLI